MHRNDTSDGSVRVSFQYPDANLGDWNGCVGLFNVLSGLDDGWTEEFALGAPLEGRRRVAFRKVLSNKPTGSVTFSARALQRLKDGVYVFALLLDSTHERWGWRCLANTPRFTLTERGAALAIVEPSLERKRKARQRDDDDDGVTADCSGVDEHLGLMLETLLGSSDEVQLDDNYASPMDAGKP